MTTTKNIVALIIVTIVMVFTNGITVNAGTRDNVVRYNFEKMFEEEKTEIEENFKEAQENGTDGIELIEGWELTYEEIGINLYDIIYTIKVKDRETVIYHVIYDAVEDYDLTSYFEVDGERFTMDEIEELYPEISGM